MVEYIEREAVNALIKAECSPKVAAYLIDAVATIPAADVRPRWIPVSERLPEESDHYLVVAIEPWFGTTCTEIMRYRAGEKLWVYDGRITESKITHWMPLPSTEGLNET